MLELQILTPAQLNEALELRKITKDQFGSRRVVVVSNQQDPTKSYQETSQTKQFFKDNGAMWDPKMKMWWWNDKFKSEEQIIKAATTAVQQGNDFLAKNSMNGGGTQEPGAEGGESPATQNPEVQKIIKTFEDIQDLIDKSQESPEAAGSKDAVKAMLEKFVEELANEVDEVILSNKIKEYFDFLSNFPQYSFYNKILIYLQRKAIGKPSSRVNSKTGWGKLGFAPTSEAQRIFIWRPTLKDPTPQLKKTRELTWKKKMNPNNSPMSDDQNKALLKFVNDPVASMPYILYPVFDRSEVANDKGEEFQMPADIDIEQFGDGGEDTPELNKLYQAGIAVAKDFGVNIEFKDDLGGAQGMAVGGHTIMLLNGSKGSKKVREIVHEFAHILMHQSYMKAKAAEGKFDDKKKKDVLDAYVGRHDVTKTIELQADGVAYVVMKNFGINTKYTVNYMAMWGNSKDAVLANLKIITNTSNIIISNMQKHMGGDTSAAYTHQDADTNPMDDQGAPTEKPLGETDMGVTDGGHQLSVSDVASMLGVDMSQFSVAPDMNESIQLVLSYKEELKTLL